MALILGLLALPSAPINAVQAFGRQDPYLGVASVLYLVIGVGLLWNRRRGDASDKLQVFLGLCTVLILGTTLTETAAGSSHLLGIGCIMLVLMGHIGATNRAAWHLFGAACFPGVLLLRQTYRPHPLLDDPLELFPQAFAGGLAVYGIGVMFDGLVTSFAVQAKRAREAELSKDRFLENMSHELRTPLTAVVGYTELLEEEGLEDLETATEDLANIRLSANHLLGIIDDLLDLSRLGHGTDRLALAPVAIDDVLHSALVDVLPLVERGQNLLVCEPSHRWVVADPTALRRVFVNLLGNAAKFTRDGTVTITVRPLGQRTEIEIADTGIGFPSELAEHIFDAFAQVDDSSTRVHGGTGLGLAISRGLVASMNGSLTARSSVGDGAVFTIVLPTTSPPTPSS